MIIWGYMTSNILDIIMFHGITNKIKTQIKDACPLIIVGLGNDHYFFDSFGCDCINRLSWAFNVKLKERKLFIRRGRFKLVSINTYVGYVKTKNKNCILMQICPQNCKNLTDFAHFLHNTYKNVKILVLDSSLNIKGKTPPALVSKNVGVVPRGAFVTAPPFGDLSLTCVSGNAHPYKFFNAFVLKKQAIKAAEILTAALT